MQPPSQLREFVFGDCAEEPALRVRVGSIRLTTQCSNLAIRTEITLLSRRQARKWKLSLYLKLYLAYVLMSLWQRKYLWSGYGTKSFEPGGCLGSNPSSTSSLCNLEKCVTSLFSSFNTYQMRILLFTLYMCPDCQRVDIVLDPGDATENKPHWATFKWRTIRKMEVSHIIQYARKWWLLGRKIKHKRAIRHAGMRDAMLYKDFREGLIESETFEHLKEMRTRHASTWEKTIPGGGNTIYKQHNTDIRMYGKDCEETPGAEAECVRTEGDEGRDGMADPSQGPAHRPW